MYGNFRSIFRDHERNENLDPPQTLQRKHGGEASARGTNVVVQSLQASVQSRVQLSYTVTHQVSLSG